MRRAGCSLLVVLVLTAWGAVSADDVPLEFPRVPATEPADARKTFEALAGFSMDLLAAEPLLTSPVCLEYDENGTAWVLEMRDYPFTDKTTDKPFAEKTADKPLGRVRVLKDRNGDGVFDESTIFAEDLSWPTGLAFWKGGVFVAATPDVWYLKDTDGDGRADLREKWFTGFRKFNIQAVINNLRWSLDNRILGAGGTNGGVIENLKRPGAKVPFGANDFRFDPRQGEFEKLSGGARFGHTQDDFGNRFLCNIRNPVIHVLFDAKYLANNSFAAFKSALHDAAATGDTLPVFRLSPPETWRTVRAARWSFDVEGKLYPRSELVPDGYFTSASGVTIYRGAAYPPEFYGNAFLADVAGNLIHRQVLTPDGPTFKAERADPQTEFVRSRDIWFRPVNFVNAPDGTLHVVDMYRETIEHPWSIPDDIKAALDLESGRERGRLWRLTPPGFRPTPAPRLGALTTPELVATLRHPASWWRETAHRLLFERQDQAAVEPLRALLTAKIVLRDLPAGRPDASELAALHALYVLDGLAALRDEDLLSPLASASPALQEHALRLAESRLNLQPALLAAALGLADSPHPRLAFQLALSLGTVESPDAAAALLKIARNHGNSPHLRTALLSASASRSHRLLTAIVSDPELSASSLPQLIRPLAQVVGSRARPDELAETAALLSRPDLVGERSWKTDVLCGLADGAKRSGKSADTLFRDLPESVRTAVAGVLQEAQQVAGNAEVPDTRREQALDMLTLGEFAQVRETLAAALGLENPPAIRLAAVRALSTFPDPQVPALLLEPWATLTPPLRAEVIDALQARPDRILVLLSKIEQKEIDASQVSPTRQGLLMRNTNPEIQARAKALFASSQPGPRNEVLKDYLPALELKPKPANGQAVFEKVCSTCHRLGGKGYEVGPNLETVRHHPPQQLLTNILDPNREVSPNYVEYILATKAGLTTSGQILSETATSVTLRRANDVQETLLRQEIEAMTSSGKSLMPEGLEKHLTLQEMADLLAWLAARPAPSAAKTSP